jgi:hypothetical protein
LRARAASSKEQITEIEHKIMDATRSDEAMKYIDQNDIDLYDFIPPLQYKGGSAVAISTMPSITPKTLKAISSHWASLLTANSG